MFKHHVYNNETVVPVTAISPGLNHRLVERIKSFRKTKNEKEIFVKNESHGADGAWKTAVRKKDLDELLRTLEAMQVWNTTGKMKHLDDHS